jgi:hypothetical protein
MAPQSRWSMLGGLMVDGIAYTMGAVFAKGRILVF